MAVRTRNIHVEDAGIRIIHWGNLRRVDWMMPILVVLLAIIGWATLYSASKSSDVGYFQRQVVIFFVGAVVAAVIFCTDYRFLVALGPLMYMGAVGMLLAVEFFGYTAKGSERWLVVGPVRIQPSELSKVVFIYSLAWYFSALGPKIRKFHWFLLTFVITGIPIVLILKQPNLGTAASLLPLTLGMLYVAGCRMWHLGLVVLIGLSGVPMLWWQMNDFDPDQPAQSSGEAVWQPEHYQKERIYSFLHPEYDPLGSGWHTTQSKITVGSGGLSGKGYLEGTQTRLNYLPEHHTDFIFSLLAEERGFIGVVVVIGLFAAFLFRGLMFARDCPEMMGTLLATGAVIILAFHIFVNIAITVGLMPVTGIPLPFLSYGRSFYLTTMACVGIMLSVPMRRRVFVNS